METVMAGEDLKLKLIPKSQRNVSKQYPLEKRLPWLLYWLYSVIKDTSASSSISDWNGEIYAIKRKEQSKGNSSPEKITVSI